MVQAQGSGRIVNVASVAAYTAHTDLWYGVTKAGVVSFTRSFAALPRPAGHPGERGGARPDRHAAPRQGAARARRAADEGVYTRRKGRPEEVAEAIRWLAPDAPVIINGAVIDITDGCFLR